MSSFNILFQGWFGIPHSYAIIMFFKIIHLYKNYNSKINFYISNEEYYNLNWKKSIQSIYPAEYDEIFNKIKVYDNSVKIDLIYRVLFPYDITIPDNFKNTPICVFYTSEFRILDKSYFKCIEDVKTYINTNKNLWFTGPSLWSTEGLDNYLEWSTPSPRNRMVSHGVDLGIFYKIKDFDKQSIRNKYNVKKDDILLLNIGAMTSNKGIIMIIQAMLHLKGNYKLLLKGTGELYNSKLMVISYINHLNLTYSENDIAELLQKIIFIDTTLTYDDINNLFNAADMYISPYLAEGFGLTMLEALASGLHVIVPKTGASKEYMENIYENGGSDFIHYVDSAIIKENEKFVNSIDINNLIDTITNATLKYDNYDKMISYIDKKYSWNAVSNELFDYFVDIIKK